jgi:phospholipase/lecithinase/hemolysin
MFADASPNKVDRVNATQLLDRDRPGARFLNFAIRLLLATAKQQHDIDLFRLDDALNSLIADPSGSGFTNVTQPCVTSLSVCSDPSSYLFWDTLHPTTRTHQILAQQLYNVAHDPVPVRCRSWVDSRPWAGAAA